jgi:hypothetical protein
MNLAYFKDYIQDKLNNLNHNIVSKLNIKIYGWTYYDEKSNSPILIFKVQNKNVIFKKKAKIWKFGIPERINYIEIVFLDNGKIVYEQIYNDFGYF